MRKFYSTKKIYQFISMFVFFIILTSGCASNSAISSTTMPENNTDFDNVQVVQEVTKKSNSTNDKTVGVGITYDIEGKSVIKESFDCIEWAFDSSLETLSNYSTAVIRGTTRSVSFVGINGLAWTKTDVEITELLKGALQQGDIISIYSLGGYIPLAEYMTYRKNESRFTKLSDFEIQNTLLQFVVEREPIPIIDEDLVYFIDKTPDYSPLPSGAYERTCGKEAQFKIIGDGKTVTRDPLYSYDIKSENLGIETFELPDIKALLSQ